MRKAHATSSASQMTDHHQMASGSPWAKWTMAATTPAAAGMGIPTKYFLPGRPGFEGWGFTWMLKRARRLAPAIMNMKVAMAPNCTRRTRSSPSESVGSRRNPHIQASTAGADRKSVV